MVRKSLLAVVLMCGAALVCGLLVQPWAANAAGKVEKGKVTIDPANFTTEIDNEYFPLVPGTTFFYEGETDGVPTTEEVYVTEDTRVVMGVTTVVVRDRAYLDGDLVEETFDWYAQDLDGNVWYFGEDASQIEGEEVVGTEGSWEAGVDGALPGIVMLANPHRGHTYRQEIAKGVAEDMASVRSRDRTITVPYGTFDDCLQTKDFSKLERGVVEHKYFAPGIGFIMSFMVRGGDEYLELVDITTEDGGA